MSHNTDHIRALNDALRKNPSNGSAFITPGVAALGPDNVSRLVQTLATFDDFCRENGPYDEHDFGAFEFDGHSVFFKIDYYSTDLKAHSSDPANPEVTERIMTIMLAEEY